MRLPPRLSDIERDSGKPFRDRLYDFIVERLHQFSRDNPGFAFQPNPGLPSSREITHRSDQQEPISQDAARLIAPDATAFWIGKLRGKRIELRVDDPAPGKPNSFI